MYTADVFDRIKGAYHSLKQLGWINGSLYALHRICLRASNGRLRLFKYYLVAQPVSELPLMPARRGQQIEVRWIGPQDQVVQQFPRPAAVIRARFEQGAECLVASKGGQFIGFLWILVGSYREDEVRACFSPQPADQVSWDFDVHVEPDFRLGLTFLRLWDEANRALRNRGVRWSCSRVSAFNVRSLESHARLGMAAAGSAVFLCAGRWQLMLATVAPYIHFSGNPVVLPNFRIDTRKLEARGRVSGNPTTVE